MTQPCQRLRPFYRGRFSYPESLFAPYSAEAAEPAHRPGRVLPEPSPPFRSGRGSVGRHYGLGSLDQQRRRNCRRIAMLGLDLSRTGRSLVDVRSRSDQEIPSRSSSNLKRNNYSVPVDLTASGWPTDKEPSPSACTGWEPLGTLRSASPTHRGRPPTTWSLPSSKSWSRQPGRYPARFTTCTSVAVKNGTVNNFTASDGFTVRMTN